VDIYFIFFKKESFQLSRGKFAKIILFKIRLLSNFVGKLKDGKNRKTLKNDFFKLSVV